MLWGFAAVCYLWTLWFVYQGGKEVNDHVVAVFILGCMIIYPMLGSLYRHEVTQEAIHIELLLSLGPILMLGLFWILSRRQDAGWRMPIAYCSQVAFSFSLWVWGLYGLGLPLFWFLGYALWQPLVLWISLGLSIYGFFWVWVKRHQVRSIAVSSHGVRIVQLSDLHVSPVMRHQDMLALVEHVSNLEPDIVVVTGDLVMPFSEDAHAFLLDALSAFSVPVVCCMGNHDLPIQEQLLQELSGIGVHLLIDEHIICCVREKNIELVGLQFQWRDSEKHYTEVMNRLEEKPADSRVLLVHDPRYFQVVDPQRFELMLSGHTHGGQFGLNMLGIPISFFRPFGFLDQGVFRKGSLLAYVHKGNWHTGLPPRVGIAPEIAVFEL